MLHATELSRNLFWAGVLRPSEHVDAARLELSRRALSPLLTVPPCFAFVPLAPFLFFRTFLVDDLFCCLTDDDDGEPHDEHLQIAAWGARGRFRQHHEGPPGVSVSFRRLPSFMPAYACLASFSSMVACDALPGSFVLFKVFLRVSLPGGPWSSGVLTWSNGLLTQTQPTSLLFCSISHVARSCGTTRDFSAVHKGVPSPLCSIANCVGDDVGGV